MHKATRTVALLSSFTLMLMVFSVAALSSSAKSSTKGATTSNISAKKSAAMKKNPARPSIVLASPEQISGTISFVGPSDKEITLMGANGTPYDFNVTRSTKVDVGGQKVGPTTLTSEYNKPATVRFVPTARGNLAQTLEITG
jgi:hypothetical protein